LLAVEVEVPQHYRPTNLIVVNFKVLIAYFVTFKLPEVFLLANLLVRITFSKDDWHLFCIEVYLLSFMATLHKPHHHLLLSSSVLLQINFTDSLHQINQIHKSIYVFLLQAILF
jgi:hypothetical protein